MNSNININNRRRFKIARCSLCNKSLRDQRIILTYQVRADTFSELKAKSTGYLCVNCYNSITLHNNKLPALPELP